MKITKKIYLKQNIGNFLDWNHHGIYCYDISYRKIIQSFLYEFDIVQADVRINRISKNARQGTTNTVSSTIVRLKICNHETI